MAYLHEDKNEFKIAVNLASERFHVLPVAVEKDYYVTMILRELSDRLGFLVFKGGTSLSKCHKVIQRFSEDIDITIDTKLTQGQMKKLKEAIKETAEVLGLTIPNLNETRSRRSYNRYELSYKSAASELDEIIQSMVILETSFAEVSFPTEILPVHSYIGEMMAEEAPEDLVNFRLDPFQMKVQSLDRTLVDKVFAVCDYYLGDNVKKHSRHIYDIYKLLPLVPQNENFKELVREVRTVRAKNKICLSAQPEIDVPLILKKIVENDVYKNDYETVTIRILEEQIPYDTAVNALSIIADSGMF